MALGLVAAAAVAFLTGGPPGGPPSPEARPPGPDLRAVELLGCYRLRVGPWNLALEETPPGGEGDAGADPEALAPPSVVQLLPDTGDEFARRSATRRAVPLGAEAGGRPPLRWLVRADTLWLVWSREGVRAAAALFAEGDSLTGVARAVSERVDGSAPAAAWPVNCATLGRERPGDAPRR